MLFIVIGHVGQTGERIEVPIEANSAEHAEHLAEARGIIVASVKPADSGPALSAIRSP